MHNVMKLPMAPKKLVQVGIRDFCEQEHEAIKNSNGRINTFFDSALRDETFLGVTWKQITESIIKALPQNVYISFDIDGLDPSLCPNTGTPVLGGLSFHEANYILSQVSESGRKIIGFDLNEVSQGETDSEWDGNVGARLLYKLCGWASKGG